MTEFGKNFKKILVTGGAGYIGSHCIIELLKNNMEVIVIDNMCNSSQECIFRLEKITGKQIPFFNMDICDKEGLKNLFVKNKFYGVLHLAALKAVGESVSMPLAYYRTNVIGTIILLEIMKECNVKNFVFSSSATVYGYPQYLPINEEHPTIGDQITNPYGKSKYIVEHILKDLYKSDNTWNIIILRYFNPVGAHESGMIGEDPQGPPNNLMPYISQVAAGKLNELKIFGSDYETKDGTGVRDYIHVCDLANGHSNSFKLLDENPGTGIGYSVLEMINAFEKVSGKKINYKIVERRPGDVACVYADPTLAEKELKWKATKTLQDMCMDLWNWQNKNPNGYNII